MNKAVLAPANVRSRNYRCGCEILVLPSGIPIGRKRCKEAERLHGTQASLSKRLMTIREGSENERKIIAKIENISHALAAHRQESGTVLAESTAEPHNERIP